MDGLIAGKNYFKDRWPFFVFLSLYFLFCFLTFRQYGVCLDMLPCYDGGAIWLKYYKGHNFEALKPEADLVTHNYPYTAALIKLSFSKVLHFDRLYLLNLLFASLVFWLAYELLYVHFQRKIAALVGPLFLLLMPRFLGDIPNNPKDIPFAIFYFFGLAAMFLKDKWFHGRTFRILGLGIIFGFAASNRIVGLNLFPIYVFFRLYEGWLTRRRDNFPLGRWFSWEFLEWVSIFAVSQVVLCALWPYIGEDYFHHLPVVLAESKKYDWDALILFEGRLIRPSFFPWNYLLGWLTVMTPLFILFYFGFGVLRFKYLWEDRLYFLMVSAFAFNLVLYYFLKPIIFNGIRHYLFIVPIVVFIASFGFCDFLTLAPKSPMRWALLALTAGNALLVIFQMALLFPYDYLYFNELVGGIQGANGQYEMDYWAKSIKEAVLWLKDNEIKESKREYKIKLTNETRMATKYFSGNMRGYFDIKDKDADFEFVVNSLTGYTLPKTGKVVHVIEREGVPLTFIIQMNPSKSFD